MNRRDFLVSAAAAAAFPAFDGCRLGDGAARRLSFWKEGELRIHFIHTGVGEQTYFEFPDGTTMLLDAGYVAKRRPGYAEAIPAAPSAAKRGGEWVSRYIRRLTDRREIDYVIVSHWHDDHVMGLPDVASDFRFRNWSDHQFPACGQYCRDGDSDTLRFAREFLASASSRGMKPARFEVGALNQFALLNDRESRRYGDFEIRNLSSNLVLWDGRSGTTDFAPSELRASKKGVLAENQLSNALRIRYGAFTYYTGGDTELSVHASDGSLLDWEGLVGAVAGPAVVSKTNHHAYWNAMHAPFVKEIRSRVYLSSTWSPNQLNDQNLPIIASRELYPGGRTIYHGFVPAAKREEFAAKPFYRDFAPAAGHAVVTVPPGGRTFTVDVVEAADESMTVLYSREYAV